MIMFRVQNSKEPSPSSDSRAIHYKPRAFLTLLYFCLEFLYLKRY